MCFAETALAVAMLVPPSAQTTRTFEVAAAGEAVVTIRAACRPCAWASEGREAAALKLSLDGKYSQHVLIVRGEEPTDYRVTVGLVAAGQHRVIVERDPALSASNAGEATVEIAAVDILTGDGNAAAAQARAPILYARANT